MIGRSRLSHVTVVQDAGDASRGMLAAGRFVAPCALGQSGVTASKHEGDGATPAGWHQLLFGYYRADRLSRPTTPLPLTALRPDDGWCDDPSDRNYNRPVRLPFRADHERLWRDDHLYDVVIVLDYNFVAPLPGAGSAIFLHIAGPGFAPTEGCVAVTPEVMRRLLALVDDSTVLHIA